MCVLTRFPCRNDATLQTPIPTQTAHSPVTGAKPHTSRLSDISNIPRDTHAAWHSSSKQKALAGSPAATDGLRTAQQQQKRKVATCNRAPGCCAHCGTEQTSTWRKDRMIVGRILCNACGCYKNKYGVDRPLDGVFPCRNSNTQAGVVRRQVGGL